MPQEGCGREKGAAKTYRILFYQMISQSILTKHLHGYGLRIAPRARGAEGAAAPKAPRPAKYKSPVSLLFYSLADRLLRRGLSANKSKPPVC